MDMVNRLMMTTKLQSLIPHIFGVETCVTTPNIDSGDTCVPAAAFLTQTVCLDDTTVKFEIWDTAGQERYHSLAPMYYRGAQAAIVVYDITNQDTFGRAKTWVKELQRQASPSIVIALAGNKADLASKRAVELEVLFAFMFSAFTLGVA
ncbi:hypothetical protein HPB51_014617 [Rhipicephalus microplus]|uniref:Uncharacterized protein n=1 Tax=Rhipicephalus microplus TaxID=6941 RepID=A0A9J6F5D9_RHIMP|nr:hypothetical protein HPB51_014617 [Rhipicephalus microplus]